MARTQRTAPSPGRPSPFLDETPVARRAGAPSPTHDTCASARVVGPRGPEEAPAAREATGTGTRSRGPRRQGVGGRPTSGAVGERDVPRPRPSTGGPCWGELQEGPMPKALTWADMAPGLLEVVEKHESHQRKSRMVDISLSGSGEGPGRVTARPTLQRTFPPPASPLPPASSGACPDRAPPRVAGLQAAPAGGAA